MLISDWFFLKPLVAGLLYAFTPVISLSVLQFHFLFMSLFFKCGPSYNRVIELKHIESAPSLLMAVFENCALRVDSIGNYMLCIHNLQYKITTGFFAENTIVLAEGEMQLDGVFQVNCCAESLL